MAAIDITGAGGGITTLTGTSPVVITNVGLSGRNVALDQTQFKTINGNSIFGAGNIVIGLTNWTEAFNSGTQATSSFTATNAATNVNAALVPKGTGAIVANVPNGAASGGNARGQYAVDFQMVRVSANQVAGGLHNFLGGGAENNTGTQNFSIIVGGYQNQNSGELTFCGNGIANSVSGRLSAVLNGQSNNISGITSVIAGGGNSTITQQNGFIGGGGSNTISAIYGTIGGGQSNTVSGSHSSILGGQNGTASGQYSAVLGGLRGNAYLYGQKAHASGHFSIDGDAQGSEAILRLVDGFTDAQTKEIYLDGSSLRITGPTNSAMTVNIDIVAIVTAISGTATGVTVGDMFSQNEICAYKNIGGTGTNVGSFSIHKIHDASMAACDTSFATTGAALQVFFTGPNFAGGGTVTLRVVAKARIVETRY